MEKNLVVSTYPDQQESVVCQDPEPYLEAKLYMERMNMEHERDMGDHICGPLFPEEHELSNHWVALAAYPVPSVSLSHATVQWDVPDISSEIPSPETDICSVDELDSSGGAGLDWTINPLATDLHTPLFVEMEGPIATVEGCLQTDSELEYHPVNHADNCTDACQEHTTEDSDMKDGVTPSQIEDHRSVDGSREIMQAVEAAAELHPSGSEDNVPSPEEPQRTVCREDAGLLEEEKELECANPHTLNECGDTGKEDKGLELEQENEEWSGAHNRVELQWTPVEVSVMSFAVDGTVRGQPIKLEEPEQKQNTEEESNSLDQAEHTNLTDHEQERTEESNQKSLLEEEHQSSTGKATDLPPQLSVSSEKLGQPGESELTELLEQMPVIEIPQQLEQPHPLNITTLPKRVELQIIGSKRSDELQALEELGQSKNTEQMEHPEVTNPQEGSACFEETQCKEEMEPNEQTKHSECSHQTELSEQTKQSECLLQTEPSEQSEYSQQMKLTEPSEQSECPRQTDLSEEIKQSECSQQTEPSEQTKQSECSQQTELSEQTKQSECSQQTELSEQTKQSECSQQTELSEQKKQSECSQQMEPSLQTNQSQSLHQTELSEQSEASECSEIMEPSETTDQSQLHRVRTELPEDNKEVECIIEAKESESPELLQPPEQTKQSECSDEKQSSQLTETGEQSNCGDQTWQSSAQHDVANEQSQGQTSRPASTDRVASYMNGSALSVDVQEARRLAERLYKLEGFQRTDVVRHFDKDNDFSRVVGEEYLKFFDFTGQSLDQALRSFFKEVVLIGETQERERVVQRFSVRFHECNPQAFSSAGAALTLTCAIMLLNTDLHGQNVGKAMSLPDFVSNLDGMNEGENFHKDLLKCFYNSIKNEPLEWAVDEKVLASSMMLEGDSNPDLAPRSKSNPFQDLPHDQKATVFQKGFLKRKAHADIDGKRIPWGKRSWKTFYAVLKGMVLYLQKDEYRMDWQCSEEVVSIHHALAERALDYTKRPHVFRLQTADWRVFLFEAASTEQMNSWIGRMNLVSALYSSPPFPAAVGSQRKFCRPILPASQSAHTLERQLQSHAAMLQSSQEDLATLQQALPEGRKAKARELEEHKLREEYLQHEKCRYEVYTQMLKSWQTLEKSSEMTFVADDLSLFDQEVWKGVGEEEVDEMDGGIKRSYSSPSLEVEVAPPPMVKVRRNISERRTYRKIIIPRRNKEL